MKKNKNKKKVVNTKDQRFLMNCIELTKRCVDNTDSNIDIFFKNQLEKLEKQLKALK